MPMRAELLPAGTAGAQPSRRHGKASRRLARSPSSGALAEASHLLDLVDTPEETWRLTTRARTAGRHGASVSPSHLGAASGSSSSSDTMEPDSVATLAAALNTPDGPPAALNTPPAAAAAGQLVPAPTERSLLSTLPAAGAFRGIYREATGGEGGYPAGAVAAAWAWRWDDNAQANKCRGGTSYSLTRQLTSWPTHPLADTDCTTHSRLPRCTCIHATCTCSTRRCTRTRT